MEYNKLTGFVLIIVLVGMLVGVGVLTLDKFSTATRVSTTIANESFTVPAENSTVTLAKGENITSLSRVDNSSGDTWSSTYYTFDVSTGELNFTGPNATSTQKCQQGATCYAYYTYDEYNTVSASALNAGRDAVGDVSTVWLSLIVTIAVLAIIITLVMRGFGGRKR